MLRGFVVIVVGGLGDIFGALAAGLLLGVIEVLTAGYLASGLKEAVAFALLAWLSWHEMAGNVPAATGARGPRVLGKISW